MARLRKFNRVIDASLNISINQYFFKCAGCKIEHGFIDSSSGFNHDVDMPTLYNAYLISGQRLNENHETETYVCHSFIIDGSIRFLGDSTHELKNLTFDLPTY